MTFTHLGDAEIAALCAEFGIGELISFAPIPAGTINSNYRVDAAGGRFFLRVNEGKSEQDVRYEAELVGELAARGVPTPRPIQTVGKQPYAAHDGRLVSVFAWVDGVHREAGQVTEADAGAVGAALARLHVAGLGVAPRFVRDGIYTFDAIVRRLDGFRDSTDPALAEAIALLVDEAAWLGGHAGHRAAAQRGIIHGDLFRDNVMFDGDRVVALIDFEQASVGSLVYDIAVCINAWCFDDRPDEALAESLLAGYRAVRELDTPSLAMLYPELRAAAMRFAVTRITDVYLPGVHRPGKDFRRYIARLQAWRAIGGITRVG